MMAHKKDDTYETTWNKNKYNKYNEPCHMIELDELYNMSIWRQTKVITTKSSKALLQWLFYNSVWAVKKKKHNNSNSNNNNNKHQTHVNPVSFYWLTKKGFL